jgi:Spy/CpxP family protein refolding chaperone
MIRRAGSMRSLSYFALVAVTSAMTPGRSSAQEAPAPAQTTANVQSDDMLVKTFGAPPPAGRKTPATVLLKNPAVQQELKLTDEQKKKLAEIDKARGVRLDEFEAIRKNKVRALPLPNEMPPGQRQALIVELAEQSRAQFDALNFELDGAFAKVLTPAQRQRLFEIHLHIRGPYAFAQEDVIRRFRLDPVQVDLINEILEGSRQELEEATTLRVPRRGDVSASEDYQQKAVAAIKAGGDIRAGMMRRIAKILRKKQWDAYQAMMAEPFDATRLSAGSRLAIIPKDKPKADAAPKGDAATPAKEAPARKTLRESRGGGKASD